MKQAILVTAYKNLDHLQNTVDAFDSNFSFYIHIDKKTVCNEDVLKKLKTNPKVKLLSRQYQSNWAGLNHLKAILLLCAESIKDSDTEYFHLITGHDYPIKSPAYFSDFLTKNKGTEFISTNPLPFKNWKGGGLNRISYFWLYDVLNGKSWQRLIIKALVLLQKIFFVKRSLPKGFSTFYGGSTYCSLSADAVKHIVNYMTQHPLLIKRLKHTYCAEEILFHTLLMNSKFKEKVIKNNLRFMVWEKRNGNVPANLDERDLDNINKSDALFARKFEYPVSLGLLNLIQKK